MKKFKLTCQTPNNLQGWDNSGTKRYILFSSEFYADSLEEAKIFEKTIKEHYKRPNSLPSEDFILTEIS